MRYNWFLLLFGSIDLIWPENKERRRKKTIKKVGQRNQCGKFVDWINQQREINERKLNQWKRKTGILWALADNKRPVLVLDSLVWLNCAFPRLQNKFYRFNCIKNTATSIKTRNFIVRLFPHSAPRLYFTHARSVNDRQIEVGILIFLFHLFCSGK